MGQISIFNHSHYENVLIIRVHGWVSAKVVTQRFNQIKEFEGLLYKSRTSMLNSSYTPRKMNRKNGLVGRHKGGATVTPFSHFFSNWAMGYGDDLALA